MPDLITLPRAAQNPTLVGLLASNPSYLASLITTASDCLRRVCAREFTLTSYTEYQSGGIYIREPLRLRQFPVAEITRLAANPTGALLVQNVDSATHQRATVETLAGAIRLTAVASAVSTSIDLEYSDYPTVNALAAAVNALGNGWVAIVRGSFGKWPAADFKPLQGAASTLNGGYELTLYQETIAPFATWPWASSDAPDDGEYGGCAGWRLDEETGEVYGRFPRGQLNLRIDYRAGFAVVPQAIQEAAVQLCQDLYQAALVNNAVKKTTLGPSSVELNVAPGALQLSPKVMLLVAPYRDFAKTIAR